MKKMNRGYYPKRNKPERRIVFRKRPNRGVMFVYDQSLYLLGKIKTLSESGLSFEYTGKEMRTPDALTIDILNSFDVLPHLTNIKCRTVYDVIGLAELQSFRGMAVRRCGLEFVGLNKAQRFDIRKLMKKSCQTENA